MKHLSNILAALMLMLSIGTYAQTTAESQTDAELIRLILEKQLRSESLTDQQQVVFRSALNTLAQGQMPEAVCDMYYVELGDGFADDQVFAMTQVGENSWQYRIRQQLIAGTEYSFRVQYIDKKGHLELYPAAGFKAFPDIKSSMDYDIVFSYNEQDGPSVAVSEKLINVRFYADWREVYIASWKKINGQDVAFSGYGWDDRKQIFRDNDGWYTAIIPQGYNALFHNGHGIQTFDINNILAETCYQLGDIATDGDEGKGKAKYQVIEGCETINTDKRTAVVTFRSDWVNAIANVYEPGNENKVIFDCWPKGERLTADMDIEVPVGYMVRFQDGSYQPNETGDRCGVAENGYSRRTDDIQANGDMCFELGGENTDYHSMFYDEGERYYFIHACDELYSLKVYVDNDDYQDNLVSQSDNLFPYQFDDYVSQFNDTVANNPLKQGERIVKTSDDKLYVFTGWQIEQLPATADKIIEVHYIALFEEYDKVSVSLDNRTDWVELGAYIYAETINEEQDRIIRLYSNTWPGDQLQLGDDGYYHFDMPKGFSLIINDNKSADWSQAGYGSVTDDICLQLKRGDNGFELKERRCEETTFTLITDLYVHGAREEQGGYGYDMVETAEDTYSLTLENVQIEGDFYGLVLEKALDGQIVATYPDESITGSYVVMYSLANMDYDAGVFNITFTYTVGNQYPIIENIERINKIQFHKPADWAKVNIYAWKDSESESESEQVTILNGKDWPGDEMTLDEQTGWYYYYVPQDYSIIFNDGNQKQTIDIALAHKDVCFELGSLNGNRYDVVENETCEMTADKFYVTGDEKLFGENAWNADALEMTFDESSNQYVGIIESIELSAGDYQYKVTNGTWTVSFPVDAGVNATLNIPADGTYQITFYYTVGNAEPTAVAHRLLACVSAKGNCGANGDNVKWQLSCDGELLIYGQGAMADWNLGSSPWYENRESIKSVIIEDGVTSIGDFAFYDCSGLTSAIIGSGVTNIGKAAFINCKRLSSIDIPNSVTCIGYQAFAWCRSLTSIEIPKSVTSTGDYAFQECSNLISIVIPNGVINIGYFAFWECSSLRSIEIPNSVTSIGDGAFSNCSSLTSVTIPNSVTSIGDGAFSNCSSLTSVTIPNSVTSIGGGAFAGCSSLTSIVVEAGNPNYDSRNNCNAIIETATNTLIAGCKNTIIPNSVTSIGEDAFWGCSSLISIEIPNSVTSIGDDAFFNCSSLTSITIPNSVTSIGESAFQDCSSLTSVTIPNSVTSIEYETFWGCSNLTSIEIPNSVTSIGDVAFENCSSLTSIEIPNSVTSIGERVFRNCRSLTSITCDALIPPTMGENVWYSVSTSIPVYVPAESVEAYKSADGWSQFKNIKAI